MASGLKIHKMCIALLYGRVGYLSVYLIKNKRTGPHEVDFVIEKRRDLQQRGGRGGGGVFEREACYKSDFQTEGLLQKEGG